MEKIQPLVLEMDQNSEMDPSVVSGMFEQGVSRNVVLFNGRVVEF